MYVGIYGLKILNIIMVVLERTPSLVATTNINTITLMHIFSVLRIYIPLQAHCQKQRGKPKRAGVYSTEKSVAGICSQYFSLLTFV